MLARLRSRSHKVPIIIDEACSAVPWHVCSRTCSTCSIISQICAPLTGEYNQRTRLQVDIRISVRVCVTLKSILSSKVFLTTNMMLVYFNDYDTYVRQHAPKFGRYLHVSFESIRPIHSSPGSKISAESGPTEHFPHTYGFPLLSSQGTATSLIIGSGLTCTIRNCFMDCHPTPSFLSTPCFHFIHLPQPSHDRIFLLIREWKVAGFADPSAFSDASHFFLAWTLLLLIPRERTQGFTEFVASTDRTSAYWAIFLCPETLLILFLPLSIWAASCRNSTWLPCCSRISRELCKQGEMFSSPNLIIIAYLHATSPLHAFIIVPEIQKRKL